jgi:hypothetical protein
MWRGHQRCSLAPLTSAEAVDEFLREALDDLVLLLAEEAEHREADGHVAAEEAAAFDEADAETVFGRGERGGEAGGAAADDEDVVFGAHRDGAGGFLDGLEGGDFHGDKMEGQPSVTRAETK